MKAWGVHAKRLTDNKLSAETKLQAVAMLIESVLLHSASTWKMSQPLLMQVRARHRSRLRTALKLWKRPDAWTRAKHLQETAAKIRGFQEQHAIESSAVKLLRQLHRQASRAATLMWDGEPAPCQRLLKYRNAAWRATTLAAVRKSCGRMSQIGHLTAAKSGHSRQWEDVFVNVLSEEWTQLADSPVDWKRQ